MKAKLKEIFSLEVFQALDEFQPEDPRNFGFSVRLMIGPENTNESESFDIFLCTPEWLKSQFQYEECIWGRHYLIVPKYDFDIIRNFIARYIEKCNGDKWENLANQLNQIGSWEFDNYLPSLK